MLQLANWRNTGYSSGCSELRSRVWLDPFAPQFDLISSHMEFPFNPVRLYAVPVVLYSGASPMKWSYTQHHKRYPATAVQLNCAEESNIC
jgi:hypothetical protein